MSGLGIQTMMNINLDAMVINILQDQNEKLAREVWRLNELLSIERPKRRRLKEAYASLQAAYNEKLRLNTLIQADYNDAMAELDAIKRYNEDNAVMAQMPLKNASGRVMGVHMPAVGNLSAVQVAG